MNTDSLNNYQATFQGKFILPKLPAKAAKSKKLLDMIVEGNRAILDPMPFDVVVSCKRASRRTINPKFQLYTEKEGCNTLNVFYGRVKVDGKDKNPVEKVKNFIQTFNEQYNKHKNMEPLTISEQIRRSIECGIYNIKSILN